MIVTTDVIGHGINLPLRAVAFAETDKFDGKQRRPLRVWEAAQIADGAFTAVCVLIFGLLVRTFVAQLYTVPSGSMENTLRIGDTVVVGRFTPELLPLRRGDIVVFRDPGGCNATAGESSPSTTRPWRNRTFIPGIDRATPPSG